jgi:hypothetical protein
MIRSRALEPTGDLCCLPSPHRIPQSVAGMAFNFSKVELVRRTGRRNAPMQPEKPRGPTSSARVKTRGSSFGLPQYSSAS